MNHDRVAEAYNGEFGEELQRETKERCEWVVEKARCANRVLDIGCSQGIVGSMVAEAGSNVLGIGDEPHAIEYANSIKDGMSFEAQKRLSFVCSDFLTYDFDGGLFDCIIASGVLEHVFNPKLLLKKAVSLLSDSGKIIVTVPFGIDTDPDHKRTYYFIEMFESLEELIPVSEVAFFGKWIGFVADRASSQSVKIDADLLARLESAFFQVDERRVHSFKEASSNAEDYRCRLEACEEERESLQKKLVEVTKEAKSRIGSLTSQLSKQTEKRTAYEGESLRAKAALKEVTFIALRYQEEYRKILRSRGVKLWLKGRRLLGKTYRPYTYEIPPLQGPTKRSAEKAGASGGRAAVAVSSKLLEAFRQRGLETASSIHESNGSSYYGKASLRAGIVTDEFMYNYYKDALDFVYLSPEGYREAIDAGGLSFVLFVSCWHGLGDGTDYNSRDKRAKVRDIFDYARSKGIPTVFQTIEDPTNYEMFLPIAEKADVIFTSDVNMVERYRTDTGNRNVHVLEYGVNPLIHNPVGFLNRHFLMRGKFKDAVFFAGSWYKRYPVRCEDCATLLDGVLDWAFKDLIIADRNSALPASLRADYEYPDEYKPYCVDAIDHALLQRVHKMFDFNVSLSTVKDSDTMCAMRVYEMQALGCLMLSNYALSISSHFPSVFMVSQPREVDCILSGYTRQELINLQVEGIRRMFGSCTVYDRLNTVFDMAGLEYRFPEKAVAIICAPEAQRGEVEKLVAAQSFESIQLCDEARLWGEDRSRFGYVVYADADSLIDPHFVEDAVNAFKYTDCDYVNYGEGGLRRSSYDYVSGTATVTGTFYDLSKIEGRQDIFDENRRKKLNGFELVRTKWGRSTCGTAKELGVIVPVYNNGRYLRDRCILSLLRSSIFDSMTIYIVDDGSTDLETARIIDSLSRDYDNVVTYRFNDGGSGSASRPRNKGLELCEEPYVTYLDPDNEAVNDGYAELLAHVKEEDVDFAVGTILKIAAPAYRAAELSPSYPHGRNDNPRELLLSGGFKGQSVQACVIKRSFLVDAGIRNVVGAIGQDTLFYYEMMLNAASFYHVRMPIHIYYAERAGSAVNRISRSFFDKSLLLEKHQVQVLRLHGVLEDYKRIKLDAFMKGWYEEKLKQVAPEDLEYGKKIIGEIRSLYERGWDPDPSEDPLKSRLSSSDLYGGNFPVKDSLENAKDIVAGDLVVDSWIKEKIPFRLARFDWGGQYGKSPTTFQLYLQALKPVSFLVGAYTLTDDRRYFDFAMKMFREWCRYESSDRSSENAYTWDQHAAALRTENILCLLVVGLESGMLSVEDAREIRGVLMLHGEYLADSQHYLPAENHGVFEDRALLYLGYALEVDEWVELAADRAFAQWDALFDADMACVENSFLYHRVNKELFIEIVYLLEKIDGGRGAELRSRIARAEDFMGYALMPNGICPPYGDTLRDDYSGCRYEREDGVLAYSSRQGACGKKPQHVSMAYPHTGLYFAREHWGGQQGNFADAVWTMFRSGYSSITHRQADDNHFMLYARGHEVFTDASIYNYMYRHPMRQHARSALAHNTLVVDGKSYDFLQIGNKDMAGFAYVRIGDGESPDYVVGFNSLHFGVVHFRHFIYWKTALVIVDELCSRLPHMYSQLFYCGVEMGIRECSVARTILDFPGGKKGYVEVDQEMDASSIDLKKIEGSPEAFSSGMVYGAIGGDFNEALYTTTLKYDRFASKCDGPLFATAIRVVDGEDGRPKCSIGLSARKASISLGDGQDAEIALETFDASAYQPAPRYAFDCVSVTQEGSRFVFEYGDPLPSDVELAWYVHGKRGKSVIHKGEYSQSKSFSFDFSEAQDPHCVVRLFIYQKTGKLKGSQCIAAVDQDDGAWSWCYWPDWDPEWRNWFGGTEIPRTR